MSEDAIVHRLNVAILLLFGVLAVLLWPLLPGMVFFATVLLFLAVAGAIVRGLAQGL